MESKKTAQTQTAPEAQKSAESVSSPTYSAPTPIPVADRQKALVKELLKMGIADKGAATLVAPLAIAIEAEIQPEAEAEPSVLLGAMGSCAITGCDVHLLNLAGMYIRHFAPSEEIPHGFEKARVFLNATQIAPAIGVLVYSDRLELLYANGRSEPVET